MKYVKQYESFYKIETVEDILLPYIDDEECSVDGNDNFKKFNFKISDKFIEALQKLSKFNVDNIFSDGLNIFSYSWNIAIFLKSKFEQCIIKPNRLIGNQPGRLYDLWYNGSHLYFSQNKDTKTLILGSYIVNVFIADYGMDPFDTCSFVKFYINNFTSTLKGYDVID